MTSLGLEGQSTVCAAHDLNRQKVSGLIGEDLQISQGDIVEKLNIGLASIKIITGLGYKTVCVLDGCGIRLCLKFHM
jgi:hypothetical protein